MSNKLNKEEAKFKEKLNELDFNFQESDWLEIEQSLGKKSFFGKYGSALKGIAALLVISSAVYLINDQFQNPADEIAELRNHDTPIKNHIDQEAKRNSGNEVLKEKRVDEVPTNNQNEEVINTELNTAEKENPAKQDKLAEDVSSKSMIKTSKEETTSISDSKDANREYHVNEISFNEIQLVGKTCLNEQIKLELDYQGTLNDDYKIYWQFVVNGENLLGERAWLGKEYQDFTIDNLGFYEAIVEVRRNDKILERLEKKFKVEAAPTLDFTYVDLKDPFTDYQATFTVDSGITTGGFNWEIEGEKFKSDKGKFTFDFVTKGVYSVSLTTIDDRGCVGVVSKPIAIQQDFDPTIENKFTPNGDGTNDSFMPAAFSIRKEEFRMQIYTTSGELVYQTLSVDEPWNGKKHNKGELMPAGPYVWKAILKNDQGKEIPFAGQIKIFDPSKY